MAGEEGRGMMDACNKRLPSQAPHNEWPAPVVFAPATYIFAPAALRSLLTLRAYVPRVPPPPSPTFRGLPLFDKRFLQNGLFYGFLRGTDYFLAMPYFHDKNFSLRFLRRAG